METLFCLGPTSHPSVDCKSFKIGQPSWFFVPQNKITPLRFWKNFIGCLWRSVSILKFCFMFTNAWMDMLRTTYLVVCHHILNLVLDFVLHLIPPALLSPSFRLNYSGLPSTRLSHLLHQPYGINYLLPFAHPTRFIRLKRHSNHIFILSSFSHACFILFVVYLLYIMLCFWCCVVYAPWSICNGAL